MSRSEFSLRPHLEALRLQKQVEANKVKVLSVSFFLSFSLLWSYELQFAEGK